MISHRAQSKDIFANGAIAAAKYLVGKEAGYYNMDDMLR
jgi:4-hydroxy-tetrahydrodipicolinate reductase